MGSQGMRIVAAIVALVAACFWVGAPDVAAQDCGDTCSSCGGGKKEGRSHNFNGQWNMDCKPVGAGEECSTQGCQLSIDDAFVPARGVAELLLHMEPGEAAAVVAAYGDRLLLVPARSAVVVMGVPCNDSVIGSMVSISPVVATELAQLGLDSFYASRIRRGAGWDERLAS